MLRTQQAQDEQTPKDGIDGLCEAICLDAVEVATATRVGIWLFDEDGAMICQRQFDSREGEFRQGQIIARAEADVYVKAASAGVAVASTDAAPALGRERLPDMLQTRLDLLLVDSKNQPTAMLCCERAGDSGDWRERDVYVLRRLAQALAGAIRRHCEAPTASEIEADLEAAFGASEMEGLRDPEDTGWRH